MSTATVEIRDLDEVIGERVHQEMWRRHVSQTALAKVMGIGQSGVSKKLRGLTPWTVADLMTAASALGVEPGRLMPSPDAIEVGPVGIEPTTRG